MPQYQLFNLTNSKEIPRFVGSPLSEVASAAQVMQQRYDTAQGQDDLLDQAIAQTVSTPQDSQMLQELKMSYRNKLQERAKKGDYENMLRDVTRDARSFAADYKPIAQNYGLVQEYRKGLDDLATKGDLDADTASRLFDASVRGYKGLKRDPTTGQLVGQFQGITPTKQIDLAKWVDERLEGMEDQVTGSKIRKDENGYWVQRGSKREYLGWDRIQPVINAAKASDPVFQAYVRQRAMLDSYNGRHIPEAQIMTSGLAPSLKPLVDKGMSWNDALEQYMASQSVNNIDRSIQAYASKYLKDNRETETLNMGETEETSRQRNKKLEDTVSPLFAQILMPDAGLKHNTPGSLETAETEALRGYGVLNVQNRQWMDRNGIREVSKGKYVDRTGTDVTSQVLNNKLTEQHAFNVAQDLRERKRRAMQISGYNPDNVSAEIKQKAQAAYDSALKTTMSSPAGPGAQPVMLSEQQRKAAADAAYNRVLKKENPLYERYEQVLRDDAEKGSQTAGVQTFASKTANTAAEDLFKGLAVDLDASGLKEGKLGLTKIDGQRLTNDDYEKVKADAQFVGYTYDPSDSKLKFVYKVGKVTQNAKGKIVGETMLVKMPALGGAVTQLFREGKTTEGQQAVMQTLETIGEDQKVDIPLGGSDKITIRRLTNTELKRSSKGSATPQYVVVYNIDGQRIEEPADEKTTVVQAIGQTLDKLKNR
jgi:hypothetical protein